MILRLVVLLVVIAGAFLCVRWLERAKGRSRPELPPGLLLVTAPGCSLCGPARASLDRAGLSYRVADAGEVPELGVRSVPTLLLVDDSGTVVARRSGRAAVLGAADLAAWRS
jgi:hypothetical protein